MTRRMMSRGWLAMLGCGVVLLAAPAEAREGRHQKMDPAQHAEKLAKQLGLDDGQRAQVEQIIANYQERMQGLKEQMTSLKDDKRNRIRSVLRPEQQEAYDAWMEKGRARRKGLFGWFRRHHGTH